jgi:hypothetical protein
MRMAERDAGGPAPGTVAGRDRDGGGPENMGGRGGAPGGGGMEKATGSTCPLSGTACCMGGPCIYRAPGGPGGGGGGGGGGPLKGMLTLS